ncbi:MAG: rRNA pseudouridine synthase [Clostridia bacterium]|nr:rRNA pseudouridine synthase [Clostridia bacterium]
MRINKFLAENGVASRRAADKMIEDGDVEINGRIARLGDNVEPDDVVRANGKIVGHNTKIEYYIMHKPKGCVCTVSDEHGRKTVMDLLPPNAGRVFPVGRLDYDTEGLLILTNDGDLAYKLTKPANEIPKTYVAKVEGAVTEQMLNRIRPGIEIEKGVMTKKCKMKILETDKKYTRVQIVLTEGKNREIRKMFEAIGKHVAFLKRIKIGELTLRGMDRGTVRKLTQEEVFYLSNL